MAGQMAAVGTQTKGVCVCFACSNTGAETCKVGLQSYGAV
jgi:hypothetical protein